MSAASLDKIHGLVIGFDGWLDDPPDSPFSSLDEDIRLAKAAALYADDVTFATQNTSTAVEVVKRVLGKPQSSSDEEESRKRFHEFILKLDDSEKEQAAELFAALKRKDIFTVGPIESGAVFAKWAYGQLPSTYLPLPGKKSLEAAKPDIASDEVTKYLRGPGGDLYLEYLSEAIEKAEDDDERDMLIEIRDQAEKVKAGTSTMTFNFPKAAKSSEGELLFGVLGGLRAFPDADWDVIFDVRERLSSSRVRFRAAISEAAQELEGCSGEEVEKAAAALKRRVIEPALADIEESLDELGAVPTLLRVSQGAPMAGAMAANLALMASDPMGLGINAIAHGLASAPAIAAGVRELSHRREQKRDLAVRPFWFLHELRKASS